MKKFITILIIIIIFVLIYGIIIKPNFQDIDNAKPINTNGWQEYNKETGRPIALPPYNFTFKYPPDFVYGVDIGALILVPKVYSEYSTDPKKPKIVIAAWPDVVFGSPGSLDNVINELISDGGILSGRTITIDGYLAKEIINTDINNKEVTWVTTTYPDAFPFPYDINEENGGVNIPDSSWIISITSTLDYDPSISDGTLEAIILSMKFELSK